VNKSVRIHITSAGKSSQPFLMMILKSAVFAAILFGPGIFLGSAAMQWAGFVVLLFLCFCGLVAFSGAEGMTITEARKKLDELEAKQ